MQRTGPRNIHHLDPDTLERFHVATARVADRIESLLGPQVIAERLAATSDLSMDGDGWISPWKDARVAFERQRAELSVGRVLLRTDVRNCYGSMPPALIGASLLACGCHPSEAEAIMAILESLQKRGIRGLPVGPAASSVLANAVLLRADRSVEGVRYIRWVDDYLLFLPDRRSALRALDRLADAMADLGLTLAQEKTSIGAWDGTLSAGNAGRRHLPEAALVG